MIDIKELRIGNYISFNGQLTVITINNLITIYSNPALIEPVKLTTDWLILLGFNTYHFNQSTYHINIDGRFDIEYVLGDGFYINIENECVSLININNLHRLQNLYKDLSNQELKIRIKL